MIKVLYNASWLDINILIIDEEYKITNDYLQVLDSIFGLENIEALEESYIKALDKHYNHPYLAKLLEGEKAAFKNWIKTQYKERDDYYKEQGVTLCHI